MRRHRHLKLAACKVKLLGRGHCTGCFERGHLCLCKFGNGAPHLVEGVAHIAVGIVDAPQLDCGVSRKMRKAEVKGARWASRAFGFSVGGTFTVRRSVVPKGDG